MSLFEEDFDFTVTVSYGVTATLTFIFPEYQRNLITLLMLLCQQKHKGKASVYPNPAGDTLHIRNYWQKPYSHASIYAIQGERLVTTHDGA